MLVARDVDCLCSHGSEYDSQWPWGRNRKIGKTPTWNLLRPHPLRTLAVWNPIFHREVSSCGWNKWDFPNRTSSLHDPLTAHRVNGLSTEQFSALWCLHLVTGLREQRENNRGEKYAGARAWKGEAKGEGSLTMPFPPPLSKLSSSLLSSYP